MPIVYFVFMLSMIPLILGGLVITTVMQKKFKSWKWEYARHVLVPLTEPMFGVLMPLVCFAITLPAWASPTAGIATCLAFAAGSLVAGVLFLPVVVLIAWPLCAITQWIIDKVS